MSGCPESNWGRPAQYLLAPKCYTFASQGRMCGASTYIYPAPVSVGAPGIEPGPDAPHAPILPLNYAPKFGAGPCLSRFT